MFFINFLFFNSTKAIINDTIPRKIPINHKLISVEVLASSLAPIFQDFSPNVKI